MRLWKKHFSLGWSPDSSGFKELPIVEPSLNIRLGIVSDELISTGDDYIQGGQFNTKNTGLGNIKFPNGKESTVLTGGDIEITLLIPEEHFDDGSILEFFKLDIKPYVESLFFHELTHVVEYYNRILVTRMSLVENICGCLLVVNHQKTILRNGTTLYS